VSCTSQTPACWTRIMQAVTQPRSAFAGPRPWQRTRNRIRRGRHGLGCLVMRRSPRPRRDGSGARRHEAASGRRDPESPAPWRTTMALPLRASMGSASFSSCSMSGLGREDSTAMMRPPSLLYARHTWRGASIILHFVTATAVMEAQQASLPAACACQAPCRPQSAAHAALQHLLTRRCAWPALRRHMPRCHAGTAS